MALHKRKILTIIPARGGSKGLPKKNIKLLLGRPLIAYTIKQALNSRFPDKVIVSTDSKEIAKISKKYGAEVPFLRPKKFAQDTSPSIDVIIHALDWLKKKRKEKFDILVLLEPTSPLRKDDDIDNAIQLFVKNINRADSLVGIGEINSDTEHPYGIKKIENGYVKSFIKHKRFNQRQQLPKVYSVYGGIYISTPDKLRKHRTFYQKRTIPYLLQPWQNYEIDDIYDFICVEAILKHRLNKKI